MPSAVGREAISCLQQLTGHVRLELCRALGRHAYRKAKDKGEITTPKHVSITQMQ
jgi:hypothetical protein